MIPVRLLLSACILPGAQSLSAAVLYSQNYESVALGANIPNFTVQSGSTPIQVSNQSVSTALGVSNRFARVTAPNPVRSYYTSSSVFSESQLRTISFDFAVPANAGQVGGLQFGISGSGTDLNTAGSVFAMRFLDGQVSGGNNTSVISGSGAFSYAEDTAYRLYMVMNRSGTGVTGPVGGTLADDEMSVWVRDLSTNALTHVGEFTSSRAGGTNGTTFMVRAFSDFTAGELYFDNLTVTDSAVIPEPGLGALFAMGAGAVVFRRKRARNEPDQADGKR